MPEDEGTARVVRTAADEEIRYQSAPVSHVTALQRARALALPPNYTARRSLSLAPALRAHPRARAALALSRPTGCPRPLPARCPRARCPRAPPAALAPRPLPAPPAARPAAGALPRALPAEPHGLDMEKDLLASLDLGMDDADLETVLSLQLGMSGAADSAFFHESQSRVRAGVRAAGGRGGRC